MSRHTFETIAEGGKQVRVLCGWDRPLQGYFLIVESLDEQDQGDSYLFSNLDLEHSHPKSFDGFYGVLRNMGIHVPEQLLTELYFDKEGNVGNKDVKHGVVSGEYAREVVG